eukprot:sb/3462876/
MYFSVQQTKLFSRGKSNLLLGQKLAKNWPINALITQKYGILGGPITVNFSLGPTPQIGMSSNHLGGDPPPDLTPLEELTGIWCQPRWIWSSVTVHYGVTSKVESTLDWNTQPRDFASRVTHSPEYVYVPTRRPHLTPPLKKIKEKYKLQRKLKVWDKICLMGKYNPEWGSWKFCVKFNRGYTCSSGDFTADFHIALEPNNILRMKSDNHKDTDITVKHKPFLNEPFLLEILCGSDGFQPSSPQDFQRLLQGISGSNQEYQENIKTPLITVSASLIGTCLVTPLCWPIDVVKNHVLAGKPLKTGFKHQYSFKGIGFAMAGAAVYATDISQRYIHNDQGKTWSTRDKLLLTAAPLSLLPITSAIECLKLNSQVKQLSMKESWRKLTKLGYGGLMRGFGAHAAINSILYAALVVPGIVLVEPVPETEQTEKPGYVDPLFLLASLIITTPIDMSKTRTMLGEKVCPRSILKPDLIAASFLNRTAYCMLFGLLVTTAIDKIESGLYVIKIRRYFQNKRESMFTIKDNEFDAFVPEDTEDMDGDSVLAQAYIRDGKIISLVISTRVLFSFHLSFIQCLIYSFIFLSFSLSFFFSLPMWGGGPAAKISATLFSADEIFEIFGEICSIAVEIFEIFVVNWHNFGYQYSVFRHIF